MRPTRLGGVHDSVRAIAAAVTAALLASGCTGLPTRTVQAPTAPATASPSAPGSPAPSAAGVTIAATPSPSVDRPVLPAVDVTPEGFVDAPAGEGLRGYLTQDVQWVACGNGRECADILVPLDYADPSAQAITLAVKRLPASKTPHLGPLFLNPGGPGGPGKDMPDTLQRDGLEQYDLIGWDPRGAGESTPVVCFGAKETDAYNDLDSSPDDADETSALIKGAYDFGRSCWQHSGTLLEHISTIETVRDLDLMRRLLGDKKLNYLGYSYGTAIGATYAELFPFHTGRLVLDAAVDITDDKEIIQAMGFDLALGNFAAWCAAQKCELGRTKQAVLDTITGLWDDLDADPLEVGDRTLTQTLAVIGVAAFLYGGEQAWPSLSTSINATVKGRGDGLLWGADLLNSRNERGAYDTMFYAFPAISCLDSTDDGIVDAEHLWSQDEKKAPIFGKYFGPGFLCPLWPVRPERQLDIRGDGAPPILVIGATGDNATPYQQAVTMAKQLTSGVLVTWEGEGHGTYGGKSACVDSIVVNYLVKGTVPKDGVRCR